LVTANPADLGAASPTTTGQSLVVVPFEVMRAHPAANPVGPQQLDRILRGAPPSPVPSTPLPANGPTAPAPAPTSPVSSSASSNSSASAGDFQGPLAAILLLTILSLIAGHKAQQWVRSGIPSGILQTIPTPPG
jgi:hypothetical protein